MSAEPAMTLSAVRPVESADMYPVIERLFAAEWDSLAPWPIPQRTTPPNGSSRPRNWVALVAHLPQSLEVAVLTHYLNDLAYEATTARVGCDRKTVDKALQRAKRKINTHLAGRAAA
jgi:DNA-directed RNA polymerase specialized sigma24 family protein